MAATTFGAALLQAAGGFGFAVVATPLYLLIIPPATAVHVVIIIASALSLSVLPYLRHAVAPTLLLRLVLGSAAGLPLGILAFRHSDPVVVRVVAGTIVLAFALTLGVQHACSRRPHIVAMSPKRDLAAGAISGAATALVGMAGPPLLIYLLLAGSASQVIRATLLAFFAVVYSVTLVAHQVSVGIPVHTWLTAAIMLPFAFFGGFIGRPLGDRLGTGAFTILAIALLAVAGLLTLVE